LDEPQKHDSELDSLEEIAFWDSPSRRRYHSVQGPRVSQISKESRKIYEYENDSDEYDEEIDVESFGDDYGEVS
jgi:hypothetical protein